MQLRQELKQSFERNAKSNKPVKRVIFNNIQFRTNTENILLRKLTIDILCIKIQFERKVNL